MGLSGLHTASARFRDHRYIRLLSLAVPGPWVFPTLMSQAALRSLTSNLMISSMKLNHEKRGFLKSYSLPTSGSEGFSEADQTEPGGSFLLVGTLLTATHWLPCSWTTVGKTERTGMGPVPSL